MGNENLGMAFVSWMCTEDIISPVALRTSPRRSVFMDSRVLGAEHVHIHAQRWHNELCGSWIWRMMGSVQSVGRNMFAFHEHCRSRSGSWDDIYVCQQQYHPVPLTCQKRAYWSKVDICIGHYHNTLYIKHIMENWNYLSIHVGKSVCVCVCDFTTKASVALLSP